MITLHHFTSHANWREIREAGVLQARSNPHVSTRQLRGVPVVWLSTRDTPEGQGLEPAQLQTMLAGTQDWDKRAVRITVEIPRTYVHRWVDWAPRNGASPQWVAHVRSKVDHAGSWRVATRDIPQDQWLAVEDLGAGEPLSIARQPAQQNAQLQQLGFRKLF